MIKIFTSFFSNPTIHSNTFYMGKKQTPILLSANNSAISIKLGSGFMSYTLQSNKKELTELSEFIDTFLSRLDQIKEKS